MAQNASPSPSSSPPETCLDSQSHFGSNHSKSYCNTQQSMNDFAAASDCTEYVTSIERDRGQSSLVLDGFLKCIPMQSVGKGPLKPSHWREVSISPVLDPATGRVEWMGGRRDEATPVLTAESLVMGKLLASGAD